MVMIDGVPRKVDCSAFPDVHAVQWYGGDGGEVEYERHRKPNETITSLDRFMPLIEAWDQAGGK